MNSIERLSRKALDRLNLSILRTKPADRAVGFLTRQRRRLLRRKIENRLREREIYGDCVLRGPFEGMRYPPPRDHWASCRFEKLIGAYEFEIQPFLTRLFEGRDYRCIVDIGAAEGFYATGLARRCPDAYVIAFESDLGKIETLKALASLNQISDRLTLHGTCAVEDLIALEKESPDFVFCDVEGAEKVLLDPDRVPWMKHADILVETHDCFQPGVSAELRRRFDDTHAIESVLSSGLKYEDFPELNTLSFEEIYAMVGEERPTLQEWLLMVPRGNPLG